MIVQIMTLYVNMYVKSETAYHQPKDYSQEFMFFGIGWSKSKVF